MTRILLVGPSWVGDMVMAQSLVAVLKAGRPDAVIDLVAPAWSGRLGPRLPGIAETIPIETAHGRLDFTHRLRFGRALRARRYDEAYVLPNSWKSALVPFAARIPRRIGYVGEFRYGLLNDLRRLDRTALPRTVDRYAALGRPAAAPASAAPFPALSVDRDNGIAVAKRLGLPVGARTVALCPGAEYGPAKQWPAPHFAALADLLARRGYATWIFGSQKDGAIVEQIIARADDLNPAARPANLAGKTGLIDAIDLLALCDAVATNDSGLMHVAAAIGRPLVAFYGSTVSSINPPLTDKAVVLERTLPCRPCFKRVCPLGHLNCLNLIGAEEVAGHLVAQVERTTSVSIA
ncbi:MAG TPA: lipopolysaccharide heptosyltransferase II [Bauldia sp.]|nr:lipopolysaccharide heptosyltransferase II [Bauldia sp.]